LLLVYVVKKELTSPKWGAAFAAGCGKHRAKIVTDKEYRGYPMALFGKPWNVLKRTQEAGLDWYYGDHGYFRRAFSGGSFSKTYYRCTRNAYQHDGRGAASADRFNALSIEIKPWRKSGRNILVCPPDHNFAMLHGFDEVAWLKNTLLTIAKHSSRPVTVRTRSTSSNKPLAADLSNAWAVVTYASNAAVEAVIAGVPVFCLAECAARRMGLTDLAELERPVYPDREQWAYNLAANQWTLAEMAAGELWRAIGA
jgi:hypothetical protein